jgi:hypothetical protein
MKNCDCRVALLPSKKSLELLRIQKRAELLGTENEEPAGTSRHKNLEADPEKGKI